MGRPLSIINSLSIYFGKVPIFYAGDIFDRWNPPPELTNFAIDRLPKGYSIAGQHDMPFHNKRDLSKSAYGTLVRADVLQNVHGILPVNDFIYVHGFGWEEPLVSMREHCRVNGYDPASLAKKARQAGGQVIHLALVHKYVWMRDCKHPGAAAGSQVLKVMKRLNGYSTVIFGDNHKGFLCSDRVMNCGTLMVRKSDEIDYKPRIGLLLNTGCIVPYELDTSQDVHLDIHEGAPDSFDYSDLVEELLQVERKRLDFYDEVKHFCERKGVDPDVRTLIERLLDTASTR